jgi:hypothetical protein
MVSCGHLTPTLIRLLIDHLTEFEIISTTSFNFTVLAAAVAVSRILYSTHFLDLPTKLGQSLDRAAPSGTRNRLARKIVPINFKRLVMC